jgi:hypothetical protein
MLGLSTMDPTVQGILYLVAVVLFVIAALGVEVPRFGLVRRVRLHVERVRALLKGP